MIDPTIKLLINSESEMQIFAADIASKAKVGDWIALVGGLGVGKTVFAKAFIAALGFDGEVSSPSYALVHSYDPPAIKMHVSHADLYRIEDDFEYQELGLDDVLHYGIALVEWAEKYPLRLPNDHLTIEIMKTIENKREITLKISGDGLSRWA